MNSFVFLPTINLFPKGGKRFRLIWEDIDRPRGYFTPLPAKSRRREKRYPDSEQR